MLGLWASSAAAQAQAPTAPRSVAVTEVTSASWRVTWQIPASSNGIISGYGLALGTTNNPDASATTTYHTVGATVRSFTWTDLDPATTYYASVRAGNANGLGEWSSPVSFTTDDRVELAADTAGTTRTESGTATLSLTVETGASCTASVGTLTGTGTSRTLTLNRAAGSGSVTSTVSCTLANHFANAQTFSFFFAASATDTEDTVGNGRADPVSNDAPADAVTVIRDYGLENAPIVVGVIGAIFLVALTFYLIRRGLMRARGAMRL